MSGPIISFSNNPVTITNATTTPLGVGTYAVAQVTATNISGAPNPRPSVVGARLAAGTAALLAISNNNLDLIVSPAVTSPPQVTAQVNSNTFQLTGTVVPNAAFWIQSATNLAPPIIWTNLATTSADSNGFIQFSITNLSANTGGYYRLAFP